LSKTIAGAAKVQGEGKHAFHGKELPRSCCLFPAVIFGCNIFVYADIFIFMKAAAQIFRALGEETRLRIMALLVRGRELCVCDIVAALDLPQSSVSRHLAALRNAGLVDDRRQGIWMHYRVNREGTEHGATLFDLLAAMLSTFEQAAADQRRLETHLAAKKKSSCL
jgi:ArsR family transcriptional regulator